MGALNVVAQTVGLLSPVCQADVMIYCNQDLDLVLWPGQTDL